MPITEQNLKRKIQTAWEAALSTLNPREGLDSGEEDDHQEFSSKWVSEIAKEFQKEYSPDDGYRTFSASIDENKKEYEINELLYDVMVCKIETIPSLQHNPIELETFVDVEWQIESEFERNTRSIKNDMNKLVVGKARNKLMIISQRSPNQQRLLLDNTRLGKIASRCEGTIYLCFVAHPDSWRENPGPPELYKWDSEQYSLI